MNAAYVCTKPYSRGAGAYDACACVLRVRAAGGGYEKEKKIKMKKRIKKKLTGDPSSGTNGRVSGVTAVPPTLIGAIATERAPRTGWLYVPVKINTNWRQRTDAHAAARTPRRGGTALFEGGRDDRAVNDKRRACGKRPEK